MPSQRARRTSLIALAAVTVAGAATGITYAATVTTPQVLHACSNAHGTLRLLNHGQCPDGYAKVAINKQGPRGSAGPSGPSGPTGATGPGAVAALAQTTVPTPNSGYATIPGMSLTMQAVCGASNTASLYFSDDNPNAGNYTVVGSYDLTTSGTTHANPIYSGHLSEPNFPQGLGPISYMQTASTPGLLSEIVLSWAGGSGGLMNGHVLVTRGAHRAYVDFSLYLAAADCLVEADATPVT